MKFIEYNFNISVYDNLKNDILAKTNWGNKFKRYFKRHSQIVSSNKLAQSKSPNSHPFAYIPTDDEPKTAVYDFKAGMSYLIRNDELPTFELETQTSLIDDFNALCSVLIDGQWSNIEVINNSYIALVVENTTQVDDIDDSCIVSSYRLNLMMNASVSEEDKRYKGRFFAYNTSDDLQCYLEKLYEDDNNLSGLKVYDTNGVEYGHYVENTLAPTYNTITDMFGVEDLSVPFRDTIDSDYTNIEPRLLQSFRDFALDAGVWDDIDWAANNNKAVFVFSVAQYIEWLNLNASILGDYIYNYTNNKSRLEDDVKLLRHIGIIDDLKEEVDSDKRMKYIWVSLQKQIDVSLQTISYEEEYVYEIAGVEYTGTRTVTQIDPDWQWWLLDEFVFIRRNYHKFYEHCNVFMIDGKLAVVVNDSFLELTGKKVYDLVNFFIDVDAYIIPKKKSWWQKLLSFVLFIVGIVFTLMSASPAWLKLVIIANSVMEYTGNGSLVLSAITAVLTLGYNIYNVNFSTMNALETFDFAMSNINTVVKIYGMYSQMGLVNLQNELEQLKSSSKSADEMIEYIYSYAYSQYDDFYNLLYNYNSNYAFEEA
ncbi:MAG: hypothetical protein PHI79_03475 [Sulfurovaceae bacterium]|nr:hypothetical protein [Sulfurovaceae bacterium]